VLKINESVEITEDKQRWHNVLLTANPPTPLPEDALDDDDNNNAIAILSVCRLCPVSHKRHDSFAVLCDK